MADSDSIPRITVQPEPRPSKTEVLPRDSDERRTVPLPPAEQAELGGSLSSQYQILEKIGDGGMGVVYLARDYRLGRYVAIKRLNRAALTRDSLRQRFFHEAKAVATLNHIHIVHVYALGQDEDGPYIVMEYLAGPREASPNKKPPAPFSLADRVHRDGPLPLSDALDLILKISRAAEYAHSCGVIHRDLKPSNILLDESGEPKIVDFGLARKSGPEDDRLTVPGERMLSLGYGAPEQELDASQTDERVDVYGLGALLYFAITGKNPRYFRENDVPEAIRMPLVKALETDREARWRSVREFTDALMVIKAPSSIELPTSKTTWRCKWCDAVNPVALKYCGKCGWDGGETCAECGSEMRVGMQFCGACGADTREYETAVALLRSLQRARALKSFETVVQTSGQIAGFHPVGPNGRKVIAQVKHLRDEAERSLERRKYLAEAVKQELRDQSYERARDHIAEYNALVPRPAFSDELAAIPRMIRDRDLAAARISLSRRRWKQAAVLCDRVLREVDPDSSEARDLLERTRAARFWVRARNASLAALLLFMAYLMSAAPVYRALGQPADGRFYDVFGFVAAVRNATVLRDPLDRYARLWAVSGLYEPPKSEPPPPVEPAPPQVTEEMDRLASLRESFDAAVARAREEEIEKRAKWPSQYIESLRLLQNDLQKDGDFEGWSAATSELERFESDKSIAEGVLVEEPEALRAMQMRHRARLKRYELERHQRILSAAKQHIERLTELQKRLTIRGNMAEAQRVNNEIKRVQSSADVQAAEAAVAAHEAAEKAREALGVNPQDDVEAAE